MFTKLTRFLLLLLVFVASTTPLEWDISPDVLSKLVDSRIQELANGEDAKIVGFERFGTEHASCIVKKSDSLFVLYQIHWVGVPILKTAGSFTASKLDRIKQIGEMYGIVNFTPGSTTPPSLRQGQPHDSALLKYAVRFWDLGSDKYAVLLIYPKDCSYAFTVAAFVQSCSDEGTVSKADVATHLVHYGISQRMYSRMEVIDSLSKYLVNEGAFGNVTLLAALYSGAEDAAERASRGKLSEIGQKLSDMGVKFSGLPTLLGAWSVSQHTKVVVLFSVVMETTKKSTYGFAVYESVLKKGGETPTLTNELFLGGYGQSEFYTMMAIIDYLKPNYLSGYIADYNFEYVETEHAKLLLAADYVARKYTERRRKEANKIPFVNYPFTAAKIAQEKSLSKMSWEDYASMFVENVANEDNVSFIKEYRSMLLRLQSLPVAPATTSSATAPTVSSPKLGSKSAPSASPAPASPATSHFRSLSATSASTEPAPPASPASAPSVPASPAPSVPEDGPSGSGAASNSDPSLPPLDAVGRDYFSIFKTPRTFIEGKRIADTAVTVLHGMIHDRRMNAFIKDGSKGSPPLDFQLTLVESYRRDDTAYGVYKLSENPDHTDSKASAAGPTEPNPITPKTFHFLVQFLHFDKHDSSVLIGEINETGSEAIVELDNLDNKLASTFLNVFRKRNSTNISNNDSVDMVMRCLEFAARKHFLGRRRDYIESPYVNHVIGVARILIVEGGIEDVNLIAAALLHDTIEDTSALEEELDYVANRETTAIVLQISDAATTADGSIVKSEDKKALQNKHAKHQSPEAALVKMADRIYNLRDFGRHCAFTYQETRRRWQFSNAQKLLEAFIENTQVPDKWTEAYKEAFGKLAHILQTIITEHTQSLTTAVAL